MLTIRVSIKVQIKLEMVLKIIYYKRKDHLMPSHDPWQRIPDHKKGIPFHPRQCQAS